MSQQVSWYELFRGVRSVEHTHHADGTERIYDLTIGMRDCILHPLLNVQARLAFSLQIQHLSQDFQGLHDGRLGGSVGARGRIRIGSDRGFKRIGHPHSCECKRGLSESQAESQLARKKSLQKNVDPSLDLAMRLPVCCFQRR